MNQNISRRQFAKALGLLGGAALLAPTMAFKTAKDVDYQKGDFTPDYESLKKYECPEWFRDAKFGIFLHYGLNSVPGKNGHYGRFMYMQKKDPKYTAWAPWGDDVYKYHCETYGHPSEFGYKDFIPTWKADKFDAEKMGAFFKSCGAKYVVPVAVHADNFDNWDSKHHRWNSKQMGPKIDFIGEWEKACRKLDMKFGVSEHMSTHVNGWFTPTTDLEGPKAGIPFDTVDPEFEDFYIKRSPDNRRELTPAFAQNWYLRMKDLLDSYNPDLFYFDGGYPFEETGEGVKIVTHFYNANIKNNGGKNEAVMNVKNHHHKELYATCVDDIERGQTDTLRADPWQTDTTVNQGWFYLGKMDTTVTKVGEEAAMSTSKDKKLLDGPMCIQNLCDIVSKNGNLLLNIGQRADGSIPDIFVKDLKVIGKWLDINGEAIHGSRPWTIYGEGPTKVTEGAFKEPTKPFGVDDIRFTTNKGNLYAMAMGVPEKSILIKSFGTDAKLLKKKITSVSLLGNSQDLAWEMKKEGLFVEVPKRIKSDHAVTFKIKFARA